MVDGILAKHTPQGLPEPTQQGIREIVAREQSWIDARP